MVILYNNVSFYYNYEDSLSNYNRLIIVFMYKISIIVKCLKNDFRYNKFIK